ncbi:MAG: uncharacterized membrane protein YkvA (DUF1232 family) [Francisellaceae bacterium]|jgi:uncharacterized membrane protein YkvA (DUF1232 family)|uniref:YkvA family protein n=1 Tax=Pseudoalteromonas TaxID=53246 RepID=UPI0012314EF7|nr:MULTISPECIES: DUF1232 domain-containing protein [Pseudoalteromonas]MBH0067439.1 DUF1232 domain-containing protein [Pseudoalteromonas sp. NZS100]
MRLQNFKQKIRELKRQTLVVYFISREPALPWYVKAIAIIVAAYALSPIDLVPDFIPILGLIDDFIILPLGFALIIYLTPKKILRIAKIKAQQYNEKPISYISAIAVILVWFVALLFIAHSIQSKFIT